MARRILLIEDNPIEAQEIGIFIREHGYEVDVVDSAEAGRERLADVRYDLLLCDLHLPGENGFDFCRRVKQHAAWKRVPFVMLTRYADPLNVLRGLEAGVDGFISKGQSAANITQRVDRILDDEEGDRIVFLDTRFEIDARRSQLLEVLLSGFEDVVYLNEKYEDEVHARVRAQKMLRSANAQYQSLVETLPLSVIRKDRQGRYTFANSHFIKSLGLPVDAVLGKTDFDLYEPHVAAESARLDRRVLMSGETVESDVTLASHDGESRHLRVRKVPVMDADQKIVGIQGIAWDVTELMRSKARLQTTNELLEQRVSQRTAELREHVERLEQKNIELDRFVYVASHDLQEPLRKLVSFSQLLESDLGDHLTEPAAKDLHYIRDAARRMRQLVNDLLALSRAGRSALNFDELDLNHCVDRALDALALRIEESGAEIERDTLPTVVGDATSLMQLYQNLIDNAIKFSPGTRPRLHLTAERDGDVWILGVRDAGIGMDCAHAEEVFAPFRRLHGRAEYDGTGIGLAICKTTVERHQGAIWVESRPGKGAHFKFTLPVACADGKEETEEAPKELLESPCAGD